jgi:hypothetical protein
MQGRRRRRTAFRCMPRWRSRRAKLERLCRYISRPTVALERLSLTAHGPIRYRLTPPPYRDGTTHGVFEPEDCTAQRRFGRGAGGAGKDGCPFHPQ